MKGLQEDTPISRAEKQSQFKANRWARLKIEGKMPSALAGGTPTTQNKANFKTSGQKEQYRESRLRDMLFGETGKMACLKRVSECEFGASKRQFLLLLGLESRIYIQARPLHFVESRLYRRIGV